MKRFLQIFSIAGLVLLLGLPAVFAQDDEKSAPAQEQADGKRNEKTDVDIADYYIDGKTIENKYSGKYLRITPQTLSQLYWKLQVFDSGDNWAIDNYMLINECEIYQDNVNNDFEWNKIREVVKASLNKNKEYFSTQFEFYVPVHLGRYDSKQKGFFLVDGTGYEGVRRMEVQSYIKVHDICGKEDEIKDYPQAVLFVLQKPLNYVFAEVDKDVAQAYILRKQREVLDLPEDQRQRKYQRTAYVRMRINVLEYQGNIKGKNNALAVLKSELQGIDLFEDAQGKRLLSSMVFEKPEGETPSE